MDKDCEPICAPLIYYCFNPWFNGLMDKDAGKTDDEIKAVLCFNPWFNGLMDKDDLSHCSQESLPFVSTLGLMD